MKGSQNKSIEKFAINQAKSWLKKKYPSKNIAKAKQREHCDLVVGNKELFVEVKGTKRGRSLPPYIYLTNEEYKLCKKLPPKKYLILVINVNTNKTIPLKRKFILDNAKEEVKYLIYLGKKRISAHNRSNKKSSNWTKAYTLKYKRDWMKRHKHRTTGGYTLKR